MLKYENGIIQNDVQITNFGFSDLICNLDMVQISQCHKIQFNIVPYKTKNLSVSYCTLKSINGIQKMSQLTQLNLSNNQLTDVNVLASLQNLVSLDLSFNKIINIDFVLSLNNIIHLSLDNNSIIDIFSILKKTQLQKLSLANNYVSYHQLQVLQTHPNYRTQYYDYNQEYNMNYRLNTQIEPTKQMIKFSNRLKFITTMKLSRKEFEKDLKTMKLKLKKFNTVINNALILKAQEFQIAITEKALFVLNALQNDLFF
ncbi:thrombospondin_type 3 repeat-containing protein [Hexamita inflata]|uniref:Thrombospondin type 3 repeat-containing protein n=1 Tax=Hexamita inflata TaxID=28002 RepID=A0AA86QX43_9EUKA|nr:thrombospondin type 3 repeat-containing protein [Hexamita inflata]